MKTGDIHVSYFPDGDWEVLYVDGQKVDADHSISIVSGLATVAEAFNAKPRTGPIRVTTAEFIDDYDIDELAPDTLPATLTDPWPTTSGPVSVNLREEL